MAEITLTQAEADSLIAMDKIKMDSQSWDYPGLGGGVQQICGSFWKILCSIVILLNLQILKRGYSYD